MSKEDQVQRTLVDVERNPEIVRTSAMKRARAYVSVAGIGARSALARLVGVTYHDMAGFLRTGNGLDDDKAGWLDAMLDAMAMPEGQATLAKPRGSVGKESKQLVLEAILDGHETKKAVARVTGLSVSTINKVFSDLLRDGRIVPTGRVMGMSLQGTTSQFVVTYKVVPA